MLIAKFPKNIGVPPSEPALSSLLRKVDARHRDRPAAVSLDRRRRHVDRRRDEREADDDVVAVELLDGAEDLDGGPARLLLER
jgi:hypothetical protein